MKAQNCHIDLDMEILKISHQTIPLNFAGKLGCYKVSVAENVCIPSGAETLVEVHVENRENHELGTWLGIIEPDEKFTKKGTALLANTLVDTKENVSLRLLNVSEEVQTLRAGTIVGTVSPIENVLTTAENSLSNGKQLESELERLMERASSSLNEPQAKQVRNLLGNYRMLFAASDKDLGTTNIIRHKINTGNHPPIKQPPRRTPVAMRDEIDKHVDDMLEKKIIEPADGPWFSGIVLVMKKDGSTRFCIDYRGLNSVTIKDAYPLPRIDDSLEHLSGNKWFSTLDLCTCYWQVDVDEPDRPKTAFATGKGLFQFRKMPFGLACAPATFERLMERVMIGLQWDICLIYLYDIIVVAETFEQMIARLKLVFDRLKQAGLKLKPKKCELFAKEVSFLGHVVTQEGIATDPEKIRSIKEWPAPCNVCDLRSFLGLCSYYRRFIENFSAIAKCLHSLTEKGRTYIYMDRRMSIGIRDSKKKNDRSTYP